MSCNQIYKCLTEANNLDAPETELMLLASERYILIMLLEEAVTYHRKTIGRRIVLSRGNKYCCRIKGIAVYNMSLPDKGFNKERRKRKRHLTNRK